MKPSEIPDQFRPAVEAMHEMIMHDGFRTVSLTVAHPLARLQVIADRSTVPSRYRNELVDAFDWLAGMREAYSSIPSSHNLNAKERGQFRALMALGEFEGRSSRARRVATMEMEHGPLPTGMASASVADKRNLQWDSYRKTSLPRLLHHVCQILSWEGEGNDSVNIQQSERPRLAPNGYYLKDYELVCLFPDEPGQKRSTLTRRTIEATQSAEKWIQSSKQYGHGKLGATLDLFGAGTIATQNRGDYTLHNAKGGGEAYETVVEFAVPLKPGDNRTFSLMETVDVPWRQLVRDGFQDHRGIAPDQSVENLRISIRFPASRLPVQVWRYEAMHDWMAPGVPSDADLLIPDASRMVTWEWTDPAVNLSTGIAWLW